VLALHSVVIIQKHLKNALDALKESEAIHNDPQIAQSFVAIGNVFSVKEDHRMGIPYVTKSERGL
jgi:hypothetical protein